MSVLYIVIDTFLESFLYSSQMYATVVLIWRKNSHASIMLQLMLEEMITKFIFGHDLRRESD